LAAERGEAGDNIPSHSKTVQTGTYIARGPGMIRAASASVILKRRATFFGDGLALLQGRQGAQTRFLFGARRRARPRHGSIRTARRSTACFLKESESRWSTLPECFASGLADAKHIGQGVPAQGSTTKWAIRHGFGQMGNLQGKTDAFKRWRGPLHDLTWAAPGFCCFFFCSPCPPDRQRRTGGAGGRLQGREASRRRFDPRDRGCAGRMQGLGCRPVRPGSGSQ